MRVVVVGAGQAGLQTAVSLRDHGFEGEIVLLGAEAYPPYQRPPLSKAYLAEECVDDLGLEPLTFRPDAFFAERRIVLRPNARVDAIDRAARSARLAGGETIAYDHLVLATGARNRPLPIPGADLAGVHQLRGLDDAFALRGRFKKAKRVAVIGAGFIGLECLAAATKHGLEAIAVEAGERVMARAVSPPISAAFQSAHEKAGAKFLFDAMAAEILGEDGAVTGLRLTTTEIIAADLIVVGVGVIPNAELADAAGLAVENGIKVDALLLTEDPAISAIGDCASFPSLHARSRLRLESVQNAVDQARCVAARLTGSPAPYAALPWFWSDQGALKLQIAGLSAGHDRTVIRRHPTRAESFSVFCYRGDKLLAVESVNGAADHMAARQILAAGLSPTPAQAADPSVDLKALAKAAVAAAVAATVAG